MSTRDTRPILIAGPTASGKSALAMALAARYGGLVVNADSMQVYRELRLLTARPSADDEARVPHALYGHVPAAAPYSVARWLADVADVLAQARAAGRRPILVGGTGLYFKALTEGLSPIPDIPADVRAHWREAARRRGAGDLHAELARCDPATAARLAPGDTQRITRALEVLAATGRSLADWQRQPGTPLIAPADAVRLVVVCPRDRLLARCDARFAAMLSDGAIAEVAALLALHLPPGMPVLGALGVAPIGDLLAGRLDRAAALAQGQQQTRAYVKRQLTWLKRNNSTWTTVPTHETCECDQAISQLIDG